MLFHTWVFFVFFLIVYPGYLLFRTNNRLMNWWLMLASYIFYGWWWFAATHLKVDVWWKLVLLFLMNPYLLLLFSTSAIDYVMFLFMERSRTQAIHRLWLIISLVSNLGVLGYCAFSDFITAVLNALSAMLSTLFEFPNPL